MGQDQVQQQVLTLMRGDYNIDDDDDDDDDEHCFVQGVPTCFCQNFIKSPPNVIIFGT